MQETLDSSRSRYLFRQKSRVYAMLSADQSTNFSAGDHVKFAVNGSLNRGSEITLDTTTAYTNTANVASIGRFTLKAGFTYKLWAETCSESGDNTKFQWYNADTNTALPDSNLSFDTVNLGANQDASLNACVGFISPLVDTRVELRVVSRTNVARFLSAQTFAVIETEESVIPEIQKNFRAKFSYQQTSGTVGGAVAATATWTKYPLNTSDQNDSGFAGFASSVISLPAGKYRIRAIAVFFETNRAVIRFRNTSDSTTVRSGRNSQSGSGDSTSSESVISWHEFTITSTKNFELQYYVQSTNSTSDLGPAMSSGEPEIFGEIEIERIG